MPRLPINSKYCDLWRVGAFASSKLYTRLKPSIGVCFTPLIIVGSLTPAASRIVGAMSMTEQNCERTSPVFLMRLGQETTRLLRVPPKCEATCFVHWNGVHIACAQPTG